MSTPPKKRIRKEDAAIAQDVLANLQKITKNLDDSADLCGECRRPLYRNWAEQMAKVELAGMIERLEKLLANTKGGAR